MKIKKQFVRTDGIWETVWEHTDSSSQKLVEGWNVLPNGNRILWWDVEQVGFSTSQYQEP